MPEVVGAVIGAIAVIGIPLTAWLSRRTTREGRLLLRVERLGAAYALMPDSSERVSFEAHLNAAVRDLNAWLNPDNAKHRKIIGRVSVWTYAIGIIFFVALQPSAASGTNPLASWWAGILIGFAIVGVTTATSYVLERRSRKDKADAAKAVEDAAAAVRIDALARGEVPAREK